jgi:hypothetical protein
MVNLAVEFTAAFVLLAGGARAGQAGRDRPQVRTGAVPYLRPAKTGTMAASVTYCDVAHMSPDKPLW